MIADFDDFVTWMYVLIDDIWQQIGPLYQRPGPQPDCSADLLSEGAEPTRLALEDGDHRWVSDKRLTARWLERGAAQQDTRLERRMVLRQFQQRCPAPRPHDLDEAEAVDRGALERLGQVRVDRRRCLLAG